jgi:hypothetical protein
MLVSRGKAEAALEAYASTENAPIMANSNWLEQIAGREIDVAAARLPAEISAAARQRGKPQDPFTAVAHAFGLLRSEFPPAGQAIPA